MSSLRRVEDCTESKVASYTSVVVDRTKCFPMSSSAQQPEHCKTQVEKYCFLHFCIIIPVAEGHVLECSTEPLNPPELSCEE